jgi:hypothetical protein
MRKLKSIGGQYGGQISINAAPLADLSFLSGVEQVGVGLIEISNNPNLSVCEAQAFASKWLSPMGNVHTDGNLACAKTCTGSVCPN